MPEQLPEIMERLDHIAICVDLLVFIATGAICVVAGYLVCKWKFPNA